MDILDPNSSLAWPAPLLECLSTHHDLLLGWERRTGSVLAPLYDAAINEVDAAIRPYALIGWHCTRLTEAEIEEILRAGMHLPNEATLRARIEARVRAGDLTQEIADMLKRRHEAADLGRSGMVWFCFSPPRSAGEAGIERFFRHWGGEALYNSHEDDPVTSPALNRVGVPCIIEAKVPIALLSRYGGLSTKIVRRFLIDRGLATVEPVDHEDRIEAPLPAQHIRQIIRHPSPKFSELTGCADWDYPVGALVRRDGLR